MDEDDAKQVTWDLMLTVRRLNDNRDHHNTNDPRHEALVSLHGEALKRFGHDGFEA